jgi:chromosome segregation ATPase
MKASVGPRSASALGQNPMSFSDDETTPIGTARTTDNGSLGSVSSFNAKMRPPELKSSEEEIARLRSQLEERDKQLKEQASSLAEMESSLAEVQSLMGGPDAGRRNNRSGLEDNDAGQLRALLREKNEKIAMLTAEFDAHRADFRSTIDTLELASTETERVYEKKLEDLVQEIREYQDRSDDVDSVAKQLKQLEELVQELEEGLEDARRGEAEARGEVEFLRGEVERGRSELRREREKAAAMLSGSGHGTNGESSAKEVEQRDDEIRGLKAIIHSLSRDAVPDNPDLQKTPTQRNGSHPRARRTSQQSADERLAREKLERELAELRAVIETKSNREEELERELERFRRGSASVSAPNQRTSAMTTASNGTVTQDRSSMRDSKGTVVSWRDREVLKSPEQHRRGNTLDTMPESDTYSSATDGSTLWCEICETAGHDILTCTNMFGSKQGTSNGNGDYVVPATLPVPQRTGRDVVREGLRGLSPKIPGGEFAPAPLSPLKKASPRPSPIPIIPNPMDQGPVAGKESGVVDVNKWCALCERDGHESVDCPFDNVF